MRPGVAPRRVAGAQSVAMSARASSSVAPLSSRSRVIAALGLPRQDERADRLVDGCRLVIRGLLGADAARVVARHHVLPAHSPCRSPPGAPPPIGRSRLIVTESPERTRADDDARRQCSASKHTPPTVLPGRFT